MKPDAVEHVRDAIWSLCACLPTTRGRLAASLGLPQDALVVPRGQPCAVVALPGSGNVEPAQVRVYRVRGGAGRARRFAAASAELSAGDLRVPRVRWRRRFRSGAGWRVAMGVTNVAGEAFRPESEREADAIGHELRRWHQCALSHRRFVTPDPVARMLMWHKDRTERGRAAEPLRWPEWVKAATAIASPLDARELVGPVGLSPGSLGKGQPLRLADGALGWTDLDAVAWRPLRFDLVEASLDLLAAQPTFVERFEATYFHDDRLGLEAWSGQRLAWYRLCLLATMLGESVADAHGDVCDPSVENAAARRRAALCAAAFAIEHGSAGAGQLLSEMSVMAQRWMRQSEEPRQAPRHPARSLAG